MIVLSDNRLAFVSLPALTEIMCIYEAYKNQYDFCKLYNQVDDNGDVTAVILKFYFRVMIEVKSTCDYVEIVNFCSMISDAKSFITHDKNLADAFSDTGDFSCKCGQAFVKQRENKNKDSKLICDLNRSYEILKAVFPLHVTDEGYMQWYCDMSHRIRRSLSAVYCYDNNGTITVSGIDNKYAFLRQVAVKDKGMGTGSFMLSALEAELNSECISVDSKNEKADRFYIKNGFNVYGRWYELNREE